MIGILTSNRKVIGLVTVCLVTGGLVGFILAHRMMEDMPHMTDRGMSGMQGGSGMKDMAEQ